MFENLSERLERSFKILKGQGKITELNVAETLKEVRRSLLDADVNYKIAKDFTNRVKEKALGMNVLTAVKPGQMMVKIVHDELVCMIFYTKRRDDMEILTIKNLTKKYDKVEVLRNINMHVTEGEIYGLIGKNGAGKTTLMKAILGLTDIAGGEIKLWGKTISNMPSLYNRIGANLDFQGFYPELSAYENLKVFSNIRGVTKKYAIEEALEKVDLFNEKDKKYKRFSLGMKKRLGLANAIIHEPEFIILDEPTNGLDPIGISQFREYLMKISKEQETTIMISSHLLSEIDIMADRIGVLNEGVLIAEKSIEEIRQGNRTHIKILVTNGELTCGILEKIFHVEDYEVVDKNTIYIYNLKLNREEFSKELAKYGVGIMEIGVEEENLEAYFKKIIQGD